MLYRDWYPLGVSQTDMLPCLRGDTIRVPGGFRRWVFVDGVSFDALALGLEKKY
jgi:hypothetical protein